MRAATETAAPRCEMAFAIRNLVSSDHMLLLATLIGGLL